MPPGSAPDEEEGDGVAAAAAPEACGPPAARNSSTLSDHRLQNLSIASFERIASTASAGGGSNDRRPAPRSKGVGKAAFAKLRATFESKAAGPELPAGLRGVSPLFRERCFLLYAHYCPARLPEVDSILEKRASDAKRLEQLWPTMLKRYGDWPPTAPPKEPARPELDDWARCHGVAEFAVLLSGWGCTDPGGASVQTLVQWGLSPASARRVAEAASASNGPPPLASPTVSPSARPESGKGLKLLSTFRGRRKRDDDPTSPDRRRRALPRVGDRVEHLQDGEWRDGAEVESAHADGTVVLRDTATGAVTKVRAEHTRAATAAVGWTKEDQDRLQELRDMVRRSGAEPSKEAEAEIAALSAKYDSFIEEGLRSMQHGSPQEKTKVGKLRELFTRKGRDGSQSPFRSPDSSTVNTCHAQTRSDWKAADQAQQQHPSFRPPDLDTDDSGRPAQSFMYNGAMWWWAVDEGTEGGMESTAASRQKDPFAMHPLSRAPERAQRLEARTRRRRERAASPAASPPLSPRGSPRWINASDGSSSQDSADAINMTMPELIAHTDALLRSYVTGGAGPGRASPPAPSSRQRWGDGAPLRLRQLWLASREKLIRLGREGCSHDSLTTSRQLPRLRQLLSAADFKPPSRHGSFRRLPLFDPRVVPLNVKQRTGGRMLGLLLSAATRRLRWVSACADLPVLRDASASPASTPVRAAVDGTADELRCVEMLSDASSGHHSLPRYERSPATPGPGSPAADLSTLAPPSEPAIRIAPLVMSPAVVSRRRRRSSVQRPGSPNPRARLRRARHARPQVQRASSSPSSAPEREGPEM
eukprot:TRINITY_DN7227_c2_g1_i2.p1 TRINITY_DN7227_c2_g1~~TRINITY_DN7227_c2_g1_i2.p1  ORF type:complete len:817 (+),score=298.22 TRINITY_DN7227_c2_g1_i2:106-2556(+)